MLAMPVARRDFLNVFDIGPLDGVFRQEISQVAHAVALGTHHQQHLPELQVGNRLRQLKAELRVVPLWPGPRPECPAAPD